MTITAYRARTTGAYPLTLDEVRQRSGVGFGEEPDGDVLDLADVDAVQAASLPAYDPATHTIAEDAPEEEGGVWRQKWVVTERPTPVITPDAVNAEASRRIASGFTFAGKRYDYDDKAQKRITGAATLAGFAAAAGAPAGYLLWHGGTEPFAWIAMDNSLTEMDAPTCFAFGQAAASWESGHVFAGRALKDAEGGIPANFAADEHWPAAE